MMLMKTPTSGTSTGSAGRDVIFRLSVEPAADSASKMRTFGDGMQKVQTEVAAASGRRAKDIQNFYRQAFDEVLKHGEGVFERLAEKSRMMAGRIAADWNGAMRGLGSPGGPMGGGSAGGGSSGFQMNMAGLAASARAPSIYPSMGGGPAPWAPPANMAGLGFGTPAWQSSHSFPSMVGSGSSGSPAASGGGGGIAGGGGGFNFGAINSILGGGANLARGAVYAGMAGEQDSQKVLDALLRMEGLLALIHGTLAIGKGLGGLGIPGLGVGVGTAAMAAIASVGYAGAGIYGLSQEGQPKNIGNKTTGTPWWMMGSLLYGVGGGEGELQQGSAAGSDWRNFRSGIRRAESQEKYLTEAEKTRRWRMGEDASAFSTGNAERQFSAQYRRMGKRGDAAELGELRVDMAEANAALDKAKDLEAEKRAGEEGVKHTLQRRQIELEIEEIRKRESEILVRGEREASSLALQRSQNTLGLSQQGLAAQGGLAKSAAGRLRSDQARLGQLSPLERMRTEAAFAAVRGGTATKEQEQIAGSYNAFGDTVEAKQAQRGKSPWFADLQREAEASAGEFQRRAAAVVADARVVVDQQHKIILELKKDDLAAGNAAEQALEIFKELIAAQNRETAAKLDELRREINGEKRAREINARR